MSNKKENMENVDELHNDECEEIGNANEGHDGENELNSDSSECEALKARLQDKTKQCEEYFNALQRASAEFDNYKKRTAREKEGLYSEAVSDAVAAFLPAIDNMERAIGSCCKEDENKSFKDGLEMILKQFKDVMKSLGVEEINCVGEQFDPQLHNAVMHIEDEEYGENVVVEEFQKGYILKEKVIRHSMVKVAN